MRNMTGKHPEICRLLEAGKGGEQVEREQIEQLLSELGLSGKGLDIVADAVELHREGMSMMQLYQMMGRTRGLGCYAVSNRISAAITKGWSRRTEKMQSLFPAYVPCRAPKNRTFLLQIKKALISAATDTSAIDAEAPKE